MIYGFTPVLLFEASHWNWLGRSLYLLLLFLLSIKTNTHALSLKGSSVAECCVHPFFYLLSALLIHRSHAQECDSSAPTIELPIGNGTIGDDPGSVRWGLSISVGSPPQQIVAAIKPVDWNNSWLWGSQRECTGRISQDNCIWFRGGVFNEKESSSWVPTEIPDGSIGLGRASSFLDVLTAQKKIASRTWSLSWGWQGLEAFHQMKGNLVQGGYDRAKIKGDNFTRDFVDVKECTSELMVYVKQIYITTWYGDRTDVYKSSGSTLNACLRPDISPNSLPDHVFNNFKRRLPGNFRGNLTFTLDSGLSITVPNHQLVLPNTVINRDGHQTFANDSRVIPIHNAGRQGASLGQSFLSYVYIHVNNDLKRFSIWQANPTEETDIVSLAAGSCDPDPANDSGSANSDSKLGRGAIAGIVIGAVAGIALVGLAIWFLIWHKRKRTQNQDARLSQAHSQAVMAAESKNRIPELDDTGLPNPASGAAKYDPGVMGGRYVSEMPTSPLPQTQETPVELPADNVRYADGPV
ncbi:uncharacterized protein BDCG_04771 [Blastomyces dermatitidis ER-3]|uniref:Peptidase A1 domain-containing protein n=1 Tax=Ajellomyces dermatitidis (strain ER-3 / ATCC MYA-2586) TaxID=559297 RepID=A0ABP2F1J6_AJEDR|nr:uncharacterized protein BDCG_04771 [Blastomyces dermatitidis ER-3]EEQ89651.2 hypothetical protein BDCG_04771 [Blastomyces dermatitidis ER-3]